MTEERRREEFDKIMSSLIPDELIILGLTFHEIYDSETPSLRKKRGLKMGPEKFRYDVNSGHLYRLEEDRAWSLQTVWGRRFFRHSEYFHSNT